MNRSLIAALCLTTVLGSLNSGVALGPQQPAQTGTPQPAPQEIAAFFDAVEAGDLEAAKTWVNQGRDINTKDEHGITALMYASYGGHLPIVQYLVEKGADVNAKGNNGKTALNMANDSWGPQRQAIIDFLGKAMKDSGAKPAQTDTPQSSHQEIYALLDAASAGNLEAVKAWIAQGHDVNAKDHMEQTALMRASALGHLPVVQYLVEQKADVNAKNNGGKTARDLAGGPQRQAIIDFLDKAVVKKWDAQVKDLKDKGFLTDPAKAGMNAQELAEFKDAITCPITLEIMRDPVRTKTTGSKGEEIYTHAYEREALEAWLKQSPKDPSTRAPKNINDYEPDTDLTKRLQAFMDKHVPQEKP